MVSFTRKVLTGVMSNSIRGLSVAIINKSHKGNRRGSLGPTPLQTILGKHDVSQKRVYILT